MAGKFKVGDEVRIIPLLLRVKVRWGWVGEMDRMERSGDVFPITSIGKYGKRNIYFLQSNGETFGFPAQSLEKVILSKRAKLLRKIGNII